MNKNEFNPLDFFEQNLSGFIVTDEQGVLLKCNQRLAAWLGSSVEELEQKKLKELFAIGSRIYLETHLFPLLKMQGYFEEVVVELVTASGLKIMVLLNATEYRREGAPVYRYFTLSRATNRLQYEQNLFDSKSASEKNLVEAREMVNVREQLIAVLGHDLKNCDSKRTVFCSY